MSTPSAYVEEINQLLVDNPYVVTFRFVLERATEDSCYVRVRTTLIDDSSFHFSEYSEVDNEGNLQVIAYGYQWMDADTNLLRRWDNAKHYPKLPGYPHHLHDGDEKNVVPGEPMNLFKVLDLIAERLGNKGINP